MANRGVDSDDQEGNKKKKDEGKRVGKTCAEFKHGEKMCNEGEWEFAPHFSACRMEDLKAVQRVFESVIRKMLKETDPIRGGEMAKTLIWEANCWQNDPVQGPLGYHSRLVRHLENQITNNDQEIQLLREVVIMQQQQQQRQPVLLPLLPSDGDANIGRMSVRHHHHQDHHHRHFENQISGEDQAIQLLTDKFQLLQQQPINFFDDSDVGLMPPPPPPPPHHHHRQDDCLAPMLFQEDATFQGGYKPPHHYLKEDHRAPMLFQEDATFQGGYKPPHHYLQEDHREPMMFQEKATFEVGYNVASSSNSPHHATAYNQNPVVVVVQDPSPPHQDDRGNIGRNTGVEGLGYDNFLQGISGGSAGAVAMYDINDDNRGGICLDKDSNVNENPSRFENGKRSGKKLWRDLFP